MNIINNNNVDRPAHIRLTAPTGHGRAAFAADTRAGMIWGKVKRSPHPHARIRASTLRRRRRSRREAVVTGRYRGFPVESRSCSASRHAWMCRT